LGKDKVDFLRECSIEELFRMYAYAQRKKIPYGPHVEAIEMALYDKWPGHEFADRIYTLNNLTYKEVQDELYFIKLVI
jgi:hypothetical protein